MILFSRTVFLILILALGSCHPEHKQPDEIVVENKIDIGKEVEDLIRTQLEQYNDDSLLIIDKDTLVTAFWINKFFSENNFKPIWTSEEELTLNGRQLLNVLDSLYWYGLFQENYNIKNLHQKSDLVKNRNSNQISITRLYELNILLTDHLLKLMVHLRDGTINPYTLKNEWKAEPNDSTLLSLMQLAVSSKDLHSVLYTIEPRIPEYKFLKTHLINFLTAHNSEIIPGKNNLHDSLTKNLFTILINLERWRWEKETAEDYSIFINLPSYSFKFYACDTIALTSKIICGKPSTPSPYRLDSRINHYYVYPYWIIPFSIATNEILPKLKSDPNYLEDNNIQVLDKQGNILTDSIDWKKYSTRRFPFTLRQRDGDENTLGVLKFIFPSKYGIYIHDTNAPGLFQREMRALSHGCIRLEKARQLAALISTCCSMDFNYDKLQNYISKKERHRVNLERQLPVHIRYFTVEADSLNIIFYNDIYRIDSLMRIH
jgi:murein L,D-transpeptidase YcbB/YkuD